MLFFIPLALKASEKYIFSSRVGGRVNSDKRPKKFEVMMSQIVLFVLV